MEQLPETKFIAGFWRRIGAFMVDCLVLGLVGLTIGKVFFAELIALGPWGRLVGFCLALLYFGLLNSQLTGGQTLGKRIAGVKVVGKDGAPLPIMTSFLRYLPLGLPWFLNGAQFPESVLFSHWIYVLALFTFGIGLSIVYLYLFNRRTRQSTHDLLVGSYVVSVDAAGTYQAPKIWQGHLIICAALTALSGAAPFFTRDIAASTSFASLIKIHHAVNAEPWITRASVKKGQVFMSSSDKGDGVTTYLAITALLRDENIVDAARARKLASLALSEDASLARVDTIYVQLVYGYDIGIASSWHSQNYSDTPAAWLEKGPAPH